MTATFIFMSSNRYVGHWIEEEDFMPERIAILAEGFQADTAHAIISPEVLELCHAAGLHPEVIPSAGRNVLAIFYFPRK